MRRPVRLRRRLMKFSFSRAIHARPASFESSRKRITASLPLCFALLLQHECSPTSGLWTLYTRVGYSALKLGINPQNEDFGSAKASSDSAAVCNRGSWLSSWRWYQTCSRCDGARCSEIGQKGVLGGFGPFLRKMMEGAAWVCDEQIWTHRSGSSALRQ
jgi:hypothetical protein